MKKILLVGYGRCGKDTAGEYLAQVTPLRFAGTTSRYLAKYVAQKLGRSEEEVYATRHIDRMLWKQIGDEIRADDPSLLIRESLQHGEIGGGVRDIAEVIAAREEGLVDLIIWIENVWVPVDPTVTFTPRECDLVVQNNWDLPQKKGIGPEFKRRLDRLISFAGLNDVQRLAV